jgi:hypothetical protein
MSIYKTRRSYLTQLETYISTKPKKMRHITMVYTLGKMNGYYTYFIINRYHYWFNLKINHTFKSSVSTDLLVVFI